MAKSKRVAAEAAQPTPERIAEPPRAEVGPSAQGRPTPETPIGEVDPFPRIVRSANLDGYAIRLLQSRKFNQMQIKFGEGGLEDRPADAIIGFLKTQEGPNGTHFHWNNDDRAWGLYVTASKPAESRLMAEEVFKEVVKLVARERGTAMER